MNRKTVALLLALVLVFGAAVGGTLAWLTDKTDAVTNTFTVGNIDISLAETKNDFKMVPGSEIEKDPIVTVEANSEDCWVFVKVTESTNLQSFITYTIADGWTELTGITLSTGEKVYYREVSYSTSNQTFPVLTNNKVAVKGDVTKTMMDGLSAENAVQPTLTFKAAAVQKANVVAEEGKTVQQVAYELVATDLNANN